MAVKQKNVMTTVTPTPEKLQIILRALQDFHSRDENQLCQLYNKIVELGTVAVPSDPGTYMKFIEDVKSVQNALMKFTSNSDLVFATLKAFYHEISDVNKQPSPVICIVLQLISSDSMPAAVKFILNYQHPDLNLEHALRTLCQWLTKWTWTDNLGPLVLVFMKTLELEHCYDLLFDVTLTSIEPLFKLIILPQSRKSVFPVVKYMLTRVQHTAQVFHKVVPHAPHVINLLSKDESSKPYLKETVSLLSALIDLFPDGDYGDLKPALALHTSYKTSLNCQGWTCNVSKTISLGKVGLYNLGNTCYMNSTIQALFMTKLFRNSLLTYGNCNLPLFGKLQVLFALLQHSKKFCLSPNDILSLLRPPGFVLGLQHDSSEFLGYLLDTLHEQEKSISGNTDTVVQQCFAGKTVTVSHCDECCGESEKIDTFRDLQLSIPNAQQEQSVQNLLHYFLQSEKLHGDNQYRCDACDKLTDGERTTKVVTAPTHLVLTLKHFRYDPNTQTRAKLLQKINLDSRICLAGNFFDLYAAVVHLGSSVDSGHYYTIAKDSTGWYKFNDSSVTKTSEQALHLLNPPETPYVLFYAREDVLEPENLSCDSLPSDLQQAVFKDHSDSDISKTPFALESKRRNDDPPPPGCGGGSFNAPSGNMYIC